MTSLIIGLAIVAVSAIVGYVLGFICGHDNAMSLIKGWKRDD